MGRFLLGDFFADDERASDFLAGALFTTFFVGRFLLGDF
jgi:hypothetical protein